MRRAFYDDPGYRLRQSIRTRSEWKEGRYDHLMGVVLAERKCKRMECGNIFKVESFEPKVFCSQSCSAIHNNALRGPVSLETRNKISSSVREYAKLHGSNTPKIPPLQRICPNCGKQFATFKWQNHIYCSVACAMHVIGSRPTSPKAARGKYGVRKDIDPNICFFSRWEANVARIYTFLELDWVFQPRTFQLETQKYTPDFYLPDLDQYVEVKNFLSDYSKNRDFQFRKLYPDKQLILILKDDYLQLQELFTPYISEWEYANSK